MEQFTLINKQRNRIKVFKPFMSSLKQAQEMMEIEYGCVYKRSSKPVMKGSRVETIEQARKEYMELYFPPFLDEYFLFLHFHYFLLIDQESLNKENKVRTIRLTTA